MDLEARLRQREEDAFRSEVAAQCLPIFQATALKAEEQKDFIQKLSQAKTNRETFATVTPLLARMAQRLKEAQAQQNRPENIMAAAPRAMVNASGRLAPHAAKADLETFENLLAQRRMADLEYNCVGLPYSTESAAVVNASAHTPLGAPTSEPRQASAAAPPSALDAHFGDIFSQAFPQ